MSVFKEETETKRVIFNVRLDLAKRLEKAKKESRSISKKLDVDSAIDKALEKFLKKAEKKIYEVKKKKGMVSPLVIGEKEHQISEETDDQETADESEMSEDEQ